MYSSVFWMDQFDFPLRRSKDVVKQHIDQVVERGRMQGMTIDGILVTDLLAAHHASKAADV